MDQPSHSSLDRSITVVHTATVASFGSIAAEAGGGRNRHQLRLRLGSNVSGLASTPELARRIDLTAFDLATNICIILSSKGNSNDLRRLSKNM